MKTIIRLVVFALYKTYNIIGALWMVFVMPSRRRWFIKQIKARKR